MLMGLIDAAKVAGTPQTTTWDPANAGPNLLLSNGNKTIASNGGSGYNTWLSTTSKTTGLFYVEMYLDVVTAGSEDNELYGFCLNNQTLGQYLTFSGDAGFIRGKSSVAGGASGIVTFNAANVPTYTAASTDTLSFALDFTNGKGWVAYNNTWGGDPGAGTNPAFTWTTGSAFFMGGSFNTGVATTAKATIRTASSTIYSPPSGFSSWD